MSIAEDLRPNSRESTGFIAAMRDAVERVEGALAQLRGLTTQPGLACPGATASPHELIHAAVAMERQATYAQLHARQLLHLVDDKD